MALQEVLSNAIVPRFTALPSTPTNGMTIAYAMAAAPGSGQPSDWLLRYNSAIGDAYKWEVLGGPPLVGRNATTFNCFPVGQSVISYTPPLAGVYCIDVRLHHLLGPWFGDVRINGTVIIQARPNRLQTGDYPGGYEQSADAVVTTAGHVLDFITANNGGNAATAQLFELYARPYRVG